MRYLTPLQANTLLQELPEHLADMVTFSLATGLRRANVTKLELSQVDIARWVAWIHEDQTKAVFTYKGKPPGQHESLVEVPSGISAQIQGHAPQGVREQNYIRRPLDLLRM